MTKPTGGGHIVQSPVGLYVVKLTDDEIAQAEKAASDGMASGVEADTERTYLQVETLRNLLLTAQADWPTIGMVINGLTGE